MTAGVDLRLLRAAVFTAVCVLLSAAGHATAAATPLPLWVLGAGCAVVFAVAAPLAGRERSLPGIALLLAASQAALHLLFAAAHRPPPADAGTRTDAGSVQELARRLLCDDAAAGTLSDGEARRIVADAGLSAGGPTGAAPHTGAQAAQHTAATRPSATAPSDGAADGARSALDAALTQFSLPMLLSHLLAAAAVGWLLHRGEAALWRLVRLSAAPACQAEDLLSVRALRAAVRMLHALCRGLTDGDAPAVPAAGARDDHTPPPCSEPLAGAATRRGPPHSAEHFHLAA